jgi:hypothetical protein
MMPTGATKARAGKLWVDLMESHMNRKIGATVGQG